MSAVLAARDVHKSVATHAGPLHILRGVDIDIGAGEAVAVVGASGSGKSTLLGLLAGLDLPTRGTISLQASELTRLDEDERALRRAEHTGFVFQSFHLLEDLTAEENIALPMEMFGHPTPRATARDWLTRLGLAERRRHFPSQLSGGEQQRVALARAFAREPALLFADEPTANLDRETAGGVIDSLFRLRSGAGSSLVLVTHDEDIARRCDRVLRLAGGRLREPPAH